MARAAVSAASVRPGQAPPPPASRPPMSPLDTGRAAPAGSLPPLLNVGQSAQPSTAASTASIWSSSLAAASAQGRYRAMVAASEGAASAISPGASSVPTSMGTMSDDDEEEEDSERDTEEEEDSDGEEGMFHGSGSGSSDVDMSTEDDSPPDTDDEDQDEAHARGSARTRPAHGRRGRRYTSSSAAAGRSKLEARLVP